MLGRGTFGQLRGKTFPSTTLALVAKETQQ
jgi:hypothetical protein